MEPSSLPGTSTAINALPTLGDTTVGEIEPNDVRKWVSALTNDYSPATVRKIYSLLSSSLQAAVDEGLIWSLTVLEHQAPSSNGP